MVHRLNTPLARRAAVFLALAFVVYGTIRASALLAALQRATPAAMRSLPSASDEAAESREIIGFFERRVRSDPGDSRAYARLASLYLQQLRETGALEDLALALHAAHASLAIFPAVRNADGLTGLALAEFAAHEFGPASDAARRLAQLDDTGTPYAILGDSLAELGDYRAAADAYRQMQQRSSVDNENVATRMARLAQLKGDTGLAEADFSKALAIEQRREQPSLERIAWFDWQLGDTAFFAGDVSSAEAHYQDALSAYPNYFRALASLGRLYAARGDFLQAIRSYKAAVRLLPDPTFEAELGDVYELFGRDKEAEKQYDLVEFIGHVSKLNGVMYNRQLAMFYADHNIKVQEAYVDAKREYGVRRDILGADTLAWTALKAGKIREAQSAMKDALRLGTRDPRLFYHAGLIARAAGQRALSHSYLERALTLNPQFDPLQAVKAREALAQ